MLFIGTVGYNYTHWQGEFYPNDKSDEWLNYYSKKASFLEIDRNYNTIPTEMEINNWIENTPNSFIFALSMLKKVTFNPKLEVDKDQIKDFFSSVSQLGNKLGVLIFKFSNKLTYSKKSEQYVSDILNETREYFKGYSILEFGNRSWNKDEIKEILISNDATIISSDNRPIVSKMRNPEIYYLRLQGDNRLISRKELGRRYFPRDSDIKYWSEHLKFLNKKHKKIFVSIDNCFSGYSIKDAYKLTTSLKRMKVKFEGFNPIG